MREGLAYAELDGFIALDALGAFVERMEHDPTFTNRHDVQPLPFDADVVMTYERCLWRFKAHNRAWLSCNGEA